MPLEGQVTLEEVGCDQRGEAGDMLAVACAVLMMPVPGTVPPVSGLVRSQEFSAWFSGLRQLGRQGRQWVQEDPSLAGSSHLLTYITCRTYLGRGLCQLLVSYIQPRVSSVSSSTVCLWNLVIFGWASSEELGGCGLVRAVFRSLASDWLHMRGT